MMMMMMMIMIIIMIPPGLPAAHPGQAGRPPDVSEGQRGALAGLASYCIYIYIYIYTYVYIYMIIYIYMTNTYT